MDSLSTNHAYDVFSALEEASVHQQQSVSSESTQAAIKRITAELIDIESELREIEKDELPTMLQNDRYSCK
jgi:hypothetical protein